VRAERPSDRWLGVAAPAALLAGAVAVGGLLQGPSGAMAGGVVGLAAAAAFRRAVGRRDARRQAALAQALPQSWRRLLEERYEHYERLPAALRARFDDDIKIFLAEKRITGVGVELDDELRLLVAASAVTLTLGWPEADWDVLTEVLVYPQDFDRDYTFEGDDLAGETHPWGTVILSAPALRESFEYPDDGYHVGLHEFAHLLDVHQTEFDGIPSGLDEARSREWAALVEKEMERIRRGRSVLDDYGAENPVEFFAVSVEAFFEAPAAVRRRHPQLYAILAEYFRQDPAAWDDIRARGRP
jgi:MtfA peptidase